ncbi:Stage 0 sporulation protein J [subsurface metagenome]
MSKKALGKGIEALLQGTGIGKTSPSVEYVPISAVSPNEYQPRKEFSPENLAELAQSIKNKGILQPILVEVSGVGAYRVIAGERRYRAAGLAGLDEVPVIVRQFTEIEKIEISLIENLQREDLKPLEEARAIKKLMETAQLSQEEVAQRVGKKRSTIANSLRLLKLPGAMGEALDKGRITSGHARAILSLTRLADQDLLFKRILNQALSVREAEKLAAAIGGSNRKELGRASGSRMRAGQKKSGELQALEQQLIDLLGTRVLIKGTEKRGRIEIEYFSMDDLDRIWSIISQSKKGQ